MHCYLQTGAVSLGTASLRRQTEPDTGREIEIPVKIVNSSADEVIGNDPIVFGAAKYAPLMNDGTREPHVTIVLGFPVSAGT